MLLLRGLRWLCLPLLALALAAGPLLQHQPKVLALPPHAHQHLAYIIGQTHVPEDVNADCD